MSAWWDRAVAAGKAGEVLSIDPSEYAGLVRLGLCADPRDGEHDSMLFGIRLVVGVDS